MTNPPPKVDGHALLDRFCRYLSEHNLPITQQRRAVAETLFFAQGHVSVGDLERALRARGLHVGTATVYRTLELMREAGLIQEHDFGEGFRRYEPLVARGHHEHLICMECGKVVEFSHERLERMKALVAEEYGFRHHHHRLEIYGVCRTCQRRDAAMLETGSSEREASGR